jgi:ferredoxin
MKGEAAIAARRADEVKGEAAIAARRADEMKGEAAIAARRADEVKGEAAIAARRADKMKGEAAIAARRAGRREGLAGRAEPEAQGTAGGQPQAEAAGAWPAPPLLDEALRCLSCDCARHESCRLRRLAEELDADGRRFAGEQGNRFERIRGAGGLSFEPGKCIKCGLCVRIAQRGGDRPGLAFTGRGFDLRLRVPFNADIGTALPATASECVVRCPTGALAWER